MTEIQDFQSSGLDEKILEAIAELGYTTPTPIQKKAIPSVLEGRDVMGAAQTGTGKTAGFGLPLIQKILPLANTSTSPARHPVRALVLSPTRELADQIAESLKQYVSKTSLRVTAVYGGMDMRPQTDELKRGVEILIATPGRLLDHLEQKNTNLSQVQIVVLDEADRMLDMGFLPDISRILGKLPKKRQNLMFSATFSPEIKKLAKSFLNNPLLIEVARQNSTASTIVQEAYEVSEDKKTAGLVELLEKKTENPGEEANQCIVFVNAKLTARRLSRELERAGFIVEAIHGDKTQDERLKILSDFKDKKLKVLVATDVAARGLDIPDLPLVFNYDVPFVAEDYVHRIGRTGRAGQKGEAVMLVTKADRKNFEDIQKLIKKELPLTRLDPLPVRRRPRRAEGERKYTYEAPSTPPVDPFFVSPYVPEGNTLAKPAQIKAASLGSSKNLRTRPQVSVLLGGSGRKK